MSQRMPLRSVSPRIGPECFPRYVQLFSPAKKTACEWGLFSFRVLGARGDRTDIPGRNRILSAPALRSALPSFPCLHLSGTLISPLSPPAAVIPRIIIPLSLSLSLSSASSSSPRGVWEAQCSRGYPSLRLAPFFCLEHCARFSYFVYYVLDLTEKYYRPLYIAYRHMHAP